MDVGQAFATFALSIGLGLLVGMQRESVDAPLAGVRTFALITLFGTLAGMLALTFGAWVIVAGLLAVAAATASGNLLESRKSRDDSGITTEIAVLVMYALGAYLVTGSRAVAVVLGGGVAVLLQFKPAMHGFVKRLGADDMRMIMQFVLISMVILPVLPDRTFGPFAVLNPREIWWMVVLVVAMSLGGYVALKVFGGHAGIVLAGLIGGLISSTATAVTAARRGHEKGQIPAATLVILLATTVVYGRVLAEIAAVASSNLLRMAPPLALLLVTSAICSWLVWRGARRAAAQPTTHRNPTQLRPALVFGALYAVVLLVVAAARQRLGERGVYLAAGISGLTDMDAITLSTSRLTATGSLPTAVAWRAIVIANLANLVFKTLLVLFLGGAPLARRVAAWFSIQAAVSGALLLLWP